MGRLGEWDQVHKEKRPVQFTKGDEYWEYFKMFLLFCFAGGYLYLIFK